MPFRDYQNIHHMLKETVDRIPDRTALKWFNKKDGVESMSWAGMYDRVLEISRSLMALGMQKGDKAAIISQTRPEWVQTDLGINAGGGCTVGIYQSSLPEDVRYILNHSESVVVFAEDHHQLAKIETIRESLSNVKKIILFEGDPPPDQDWVIGYDRFLALGKDIPDHEITKRIDAVAPEDPAGVIYTSGTTGVPKGAVLTHDNLTFTPQSIHRCGSFKEGDVTFLFLPLAHVFARACVYTAIITGTTIFFFRSLDTLADDLKTAAPHWFVSVPRIFEKVHGKIVNQANEKGGAALRVFNEALKTGLEAGRRKLNKQPIPFLLQAKHRLADKLVFSRIRDAFGGRVRWCISGAAPINPDIAEFFHACGILILEGLGMTENTSFSNVNRPDNYRFGWVGPPGPGIEQKIAPDGEILFRGRNVMKAYYHMPEETAAAVTPDGWLHTGDIGEIDDEGFLRVTGRIKEIIITAGGKNIPPAPIETALVTSRFVNQALVVGDRRKYLSALVSPDQDQILKWTAERGMDGADPETIHTLAEVRELIDKEVEKINATLPSYATIKKVRVIPEFTIENGLLTPTLKIRKNEIMRRYHDDIDALYE